MKKKLKDYPEYAIWRSMLTRCYPLNGARYPRYAGRGITVCERWRMSFDDFYEDMCPRPSPELQLDRRDNDKGYSKENCRWVTAAINVQNSTVTAGTPIIIHNIHFVRWKLGLGAKALSKIFPHQPNGINSILAGRTWAQSKVDFDAQFDQRRAAPPVRYVNPYK